MVTRKGKTRAAILHVSVDLFGLRGFAAVSLDEIGATVGVAKQTVLYWFPSKDELLDAVLAQTARELAGTIETAIRSATNDPLNRIDAVIKAVFRTAVRRPALLGTDARSQPLRAGTGRQTGRQRAAVCSPGHRLFA